MISKYVLSRAMQKSKWKKIFLERLTEPLHLNVLSAFVLLFGSYRQKVNFDLIIRQQYAFPILWAADSAKRQNIRRISLIEFGVASGAGLLNMCSIAEHVTKATGVEFDIYGFDTGEGLPVALDYGDLPENFQKGDYPALGLEQLKKALPDNAHLILGDIKESLPAFLRGISQDRPIGFVSVDVDYYSSAKHCLNLFVGDATSYLPVTLVYLDDIEPVGCNPWTGEYLAVNEFNTDNELRKIAPFNFLRAKRIFKNVAWIDRMYAAHIHDHPARQPKQMDSAPRVIKNEYL